MMKALILSSELESPWTKSLMDLMELTNTTRLTGQSDPYRNYELSGPTKPYLLDKDATTESANTIKNIQDKKNLNKNLDLNLNLNLKSEVEFGFGFEIEVQNPLLCQMHLTSGKEPKVQIINTKTGFENYQQFDCVLPRLGFQSKNYGLLVVQHLETMGIPCVNSSRAIQLTQNKWTLAQHLFHHGIAVPQQTLAHNEVSSEKHLLQNTEQSVMKLLEGSQGFGVIHALSKAQALAMTDTLRSLKTIALHQEYLSDYTEYRVLFIGDQFLKVLLRKPSDGEFRANLHQGGTHQLVENPPAMVTTLTQKVKASIPGLHYGSLDILANKTDSFVIDVNSSPGWQAFLDHQPASVFIHFLQAHLGCANDSSRESIKKPKTQ